MDDPQELDDKLTRLENRLKTNFFEIEKRLSEMEQKDAQPLGEERFQEMEDLMLLLQIENTKIKEKLGTSDIVESSPMLEQRIAKIEQSAGQGGVPENLEKRILQMESGISSLKGELPKLEEKIASKSQATVTGRDADIYTEKMNKTKIEIENALNKMKMLKDTVESISSDREGVLQKIQNVEIDIERASTAFTKIKTLEEKINADIEKVEALKESINTKIAAATEKSESARKDAENRIFATEEKFKARMEKLDAVQESFGTKIGAINEKAAQFDSMKQRIDSVLSMKADMEEEYARQASLEKHVQDLSGKVTAMYNIKGTLDESYAKAVSLEKRLQDMTYSVERWRDETGSKLASVNSRLAVMNAVHSDMEDTSSQVAALERKIIETEKRLDGAETRVGNLIDAKVLAEKKNLESQIAAVSQKTMETEKRMKDIETYASTISERFVGEMKVDMDKLVEEKSSEFSAKIKEISGSLNIEEIRKVRDETAEQQVKLNNLESKLELAATRFFTENLEQFAMSLDKKFPEFVSKKDYSRDVAEISHRLKTIQSPDLSPLAERVMLLERRISDIYDMIKSMSNRMPIVVE